jgi:hypothetical protein
MEMNCDLYERPHPWNSVEDTAKAELEAEQLSTPHEPVQQTQDIVKPKKFSKKKTNFTIVEDDVYTLKYEKPTRKVFQQNWAIVLVFIVVVAFGIFVVVANLTHNKDDKKKGAEKYYIYNTELSITAAQFADSFSFETFDDPKKGKTCWPTFDMI